jgi:cytosine deaminase
VLAHYGQMTGFSELQALVDMITTNPARALQLADYGLAPGCRADMVIFEAPTEMDAIRVVRPRRAVIHNGQVVATTTPAQTKVTWQGKEEEVDFLRPT